MSVKLDLGTQPRSSPVSTLDHVVEKIGGLLKGNYGLSKRAIALLLL